MHPDELDVKVEAPDVDLAQRLETEHQHAVMNAEQTETDAAAWRRKQQMCEAALSQIKAQPEPVAPYSPGVRQGGQPIPGPR